MSPHPFLIDRAVLYPGEVVTTPGTTESVIVFSLSIYHLAHAGQAVADAFAAVDGAAVPLADDTPTPPDALHEARVAAVVDVLLGEVGFVLLAASTVPPLKDRTSPLARAAAQSWARQTLADDDDPPPPDAPVDNQGNAPVSDQDNAPITRPPTHRQLVATLVGAGHALRDILHVRHPGVLGTLAPFPGYTLRQATAFALEAARLRNADRAAAVSDAAVAIAGTSGSGAGRDVLEDHLDALRSA